jgi:hypothetical protein
MFSIDKKVVGVFVKLCTPLYIDDSNLIFYNMGHSIVSQRFFFSILHLSNCIYQNQIAQTLPIHGIV